MALAKFYRQENRNVSGNMAIFLTEVGNITSVTILDGEVQGITMEPGAEFFQIEADPNTVQRTQSGTRAKQSFVNYQHQVLFQCSKASMEVNELSNALNDASPCGVIAIVVDGNGLCWLCGYNETDLFKRPLFIQQEEFDSSDDPSTAGGFHTYQLQAVNQGLDLPFDEDANSYILEAIRTAMGTGIPVGLDFIAVGYGPELYTYANAAARNENEVDGIAMGTNGGEAGLNGTGNNILESQATDKTNGCVGLHAESNDTPTSSARFYQDIVFSPIDAVNGDVIKLEFDIKHVGVGGKWDVFMGVGSASATNLVVNVHPWMTDWVHVKYIFTYDANYRFLVVKESQAANDGGVYMDNISIRKQLP